MGDEKLHAAIDSAYAAALGTAPWAETLRAVSAIFSGRGTTLELHCMKNRELLFFDQSGLDGMGEAYETYFRSICPRLRVLPVGTVDFDYLFYSERDIDRDEFYSDFLAPEELRYFVGASLISDSERYGVIGVQLERARGHVQDDDITKMRRVAPHFRRALEVHQRLASAGAAACSSRDALDKLRTGVVLLDCSGVVLHVNPVAERLLEQRRGLELVRGKLAATAPADAARLASMIGATVQQNTLDAWGGMMAVESEYVPRSLVLAVVPLPRPQLGVLFAYGSQEVPAAVVFIADATAKTEFPVGLLVDAFQLTPAEASVTVAFAEGTGLREIAAAGGVTIHTVRSQFAAARAKLNVKSQSDLLTLIQRLTPAGLP